ncbi:restriction endonuclease subunit S [Dysgonomonas sp. PF1-23]
MTHPYVVNNSPYRIHSFPLSDKSPFERFITLKYSPNSFIKKTLRLDFLKWKSIIPLIKDPLSFGSTIRNKIFEKIRKSDFKKLEIRDLLEHEQPTKYIVENVDYSENPTLIPVLTANKAFVLGYTDEQYGVYDKGDCIIFDDFTMDMKYVKFSFKVKSSAIKILTPKPEINLRYMFEYFSYLSLSSNEHKRHYISEVEDIKVSVPDVEKQNSIARLLLAFDRKIEVESSLCILLCNQKKYLLREMFI